MWLTHVNQNVGATAFLDFEPGREVLQTALGWATFTGEKKAVARTDRFAFVHSDHCALVKRNITLSR